MEGNSLLRLDRKLPIVGNSLPTIQINCEPNSKFGPAKEFGYA